MIWYISIHSDMVGPDTTDDARYVADRDLLEQMQHPRRHSRCRIDHFGRRELDDRETNDGGGYAEFHDDLSGMSWHRLSKYESKVLTSQNDLEPKVVYELIQGHGRTDLYLFYANLNKDHGKVVEHWVTEEQWLKAIGVLNRQVGLPFRTVDLHQISTDNYRIRSSCITDSHQS